MIYRSPYPDVEVPIVPLTRYLLGLIEPFGDKPALIDGPSGRTYTFAQLAGGIRATAAGLHKRGFKKGDVFAIYSPNVPEYAIAFHAVSLLGGIVTTMNPLYTVDEVVHQLKDAGAKYLLTVSMFLENAQAAAEQAGLEEVFTFDPTDGATSFTELMDPSSAPPDVEIDPKNDIVVLPYSSGTTGLPKGVMLTHYNIVANIAQTLGIEDFEILTGDDTVIGVLPFFHIYGMVVIMNMSLAVGATVVTMPRFDLEQFLQLLQDHKVTRANVVPPIVLAMAKHPLVDNYELHLKSMMSGAAPLGADLQMAAAKRLNCTVMQGYGLTETSPVTHVCSTDPAKMKPLSVGPAIPNTEVMVVDTATGEPLGPNQDGEIWIRGPQIMKGYLNRPDATAETIDVDGWLHTGDIGHIDDDGHFYIVDRVKELIKYKGFQVAPAELEALLLSNQQIADAAVIPSPDEEAGEVPKAFVVLKPDADLSAEAIMDWVAGQVAPHKKVRRLEFVSEVPKSLSGKILRRVLVEQEREKLAAAK
ncbi:MAG: 4-coumarate--CoA ligase family protein [Anaerolineales bacterium]